MNKMASGFGTEDIAIDSDKTAAVKTMTLKIERLFTGVKVTFDDESEKEKKQWIVISGSQQNRQNAKEFIMSLCNPEVTRELVSVDQELNMKTVENVEKDTGAVITIDGTRKLHLSGSACAFAKALSQLETTYTLLEESEASALKLPTARPPSAQFLSAAGSGSEPPKQAADTVPSEDKGVELIVSNLELGCTKEDIISLFAAFDVRKVVKKKKRKRKLYVTLGSLKQAVSLCQKFNGREFKGRQLVIGMSSNNIRTCKAVRSTSDWTSTQHQVLKDEVAPLVDGQFIIPEIADDLSDLEDEEGDVSPEKPAATNAKDQDTRNNKNQKSAAAANAAKKQQFSGGKTVPSRPQPAGKRGQQREKFGAPEKAVTSRRKMTSDQKTSSVKAREVSSVAQPEIAEDDLDVELLFGSGFEPETRAAAPSNKPADSQNQNTESNLASVCKQAIIDGHRQEDVESALCFLDYSDREITYDELVATILSVKSQQPQKPEDRATYTSRHMEHRRDSEDHNHSIILVSDDSMMDDNSVLFVGEDRNNSVCLADSFPIGAASKSTPSGTQQQSHNAKVWTEHRSPQKHPPTVHAEWPGPAASQPQLKAATALMDRSVQGPMRSSYSEVIQKKHPVSNESSVASGCKRKSFSDDEEQTCVLKPYRHRDGVDTGNNQAAKSAGVTGSSCDQLELFHIVVDGSNVAMEHGNGKVFSCKGLQICADYFLQRGHQVTIWVPLWRKYRNQKPEHPIRDQDVMEQLEDQGVLKFTPARKLPSGKFFASHEDKWVLDLAVQIDAVVVSNDHFREFAQQSAEYCHILTNRLLPFQFVNDIFMPIPDPMGRNGPLLKEFLQKGWDTRRAEKRNPSPAFLARGPPAQPAPPPWSLSARPPPNQRYPGPRSQQPRPQVRHPGQFQPTGLSGQLSQVRPPGHSQQARLPGQFPPAQHPQPAGGPAPIRPPAAASKVFKGSTPQQSINVQQRPSRHPDVTADLLKALKEMFPGQEQEPKIRSVLQNHASETDLNRLTNYCVSALFL